MILKKNKFFIIFASALLCLLPLALLSGPFIPDLFISIIAIIFLMLVLINKEYKYIVNNFSIFFIVFYLYLIISSLLSDQIIYSLSQSIFYFRFGLFALATWYLLDKNNNLIKHFTITFFIIFIFGLLDGAYQYINNISLFGFESTAQRMSLPLNDKMLLGGYLSRLFPLLFGLLIYNFSNNKWVILIASFLLIITDVIIYVSGERTAIGLLFFASIFIIIFTKKYKLVRAITIIVSVLAIFFITINDPLIKNRNIGTTLYQMNIVNNIDDPIFLSHIHENLILTSWNMFLENPVFGVGPSGFRKNCNNEKYYIEKVYSCSTHPHNTYFQIIAEIGLIGLIFILLVIIKIFIIMFQQSISLIKDRNVISDYQVCLIACFTVTLFPFLPTQDFFNNWINIIYFLPIGFFLQSIYK